MHIPTTQERHYFCFKCNNEVEFERIKMARTDTCPHCEQDMHCCRNCEYWDPGCHNQCREHITEYITERERSNYCTNFTFKDGQGESKDLSDAKSKLDNLFK